MDGAASPPPEKQSCESLAVILMQKEMKVRFCCQLKSLGYYSRAKATSRFGSGEDEMNFQQF